MKSSHKLLILLLIFVIGCSPSSENTTPPANVGTSQPFEPLPPIVEEKPAFWLEPATATTIGCGQVIDVFAVLQDKDDPFPIYLDRTLVSWGSVAPSIASISSDGQLTGLIEGQTTISATYNGQTITLDVLVTGQFTQKNIVVPGQGIRSYYVYQPLDMVGARPLLISMHGGGGNGMMQASMTLMNKIANEQKFYVAYLEGTGAISTYNGGACCGSAQGTVDDVLYISKVLDTIEAFYTNVDSNKIFSTGFSNGGIMSHRLACELSSRISGIAAVGGASGQFDKELNQYYACNPNRPIPILHIHVLNDRNYPYNGGYGSGLSATNFYSVDSTIADWVNRNNVTDTYTAEIASSTTTCYHYKTHKDTTKPYAQVSLCKANPVDVYDTVNEIVYGGGHSWPGGVRSVSEKSDIPMQDFQASNYIAQFLGLD